MTEYLVPSGASHTEFTEKRSRFLGHVAPVTSEAEARAFIDTVKREHHDARHNCWCYRIKEGGAERYSDDGEPQGTAGIPMLEVFQREGVTNVCCVVTRYFGGILLGAGGLLRAYSRSGKDALDAAGISAVRPWMQVSIPCPYPLLEQMKRLTLACGGVLGELDYGELVTLCALIPRGGEGELTEKVTDLSAGTVVPAVLSETWIPIPLGED